MAELRSPRFAGTTTLEACLNGTRTIPPHNGAVPETDVAAVKKVQRALVDLGYLRSETEVDGIFGNRTATAISRFKADRQILPSDGVVGRKTSKALDDEFPSASLTTGTFTAFVATNRLDTHLAGLLNKLAGLISLPWASQTALFAIQELTNGNLVGMVRASRAAALKPLIPSVEHAALDLGAASLLTAASTGPFALTTRFRHNGVLKGHIIYQDAFLDRSLPGDERHLGGMLSVAHELTHHRNHSLSNVFAAEPITPTDYVNVGLANAASTTPGNFSTTVTRSLFIEEIGCRHVAWKVFEDLVGHHAQQQLAAGIIKRSAAVGELTMSIQPGQLFRSAIRFASDGVEPNQTYRDNGYMSSLLDGVATSFNRQVAIWMRSANRLAFHNEASRTSELQDTLTAEFAFHTPGFATPSQPPAGLISA